MELKKLMESIADQELGLSDCLKLFAISKGVLDYDVQTKIRINDKYTLHFDEDTLTSVEDEWGVKLK
jgi:hypothetical protein